MAYSKILYRAAVGGNDTPTVFPQTADQAALAIGMNLVFGFRIEREEREGPEGPLTVVSVYGSNEQTEEILFGQYEFYGRM